MVGKLHDQRTRPYTLQKWPQDHHLVLPVPKIKI